MRLVIGNKNYSSWSMRPWVLMQQLGIAFEEVQLHFDFTPDSPFRQAVAEVSPAGRVPVLLDGGFAVWDSLAIVEYLNEIHPECGIWPADRHRRARARSVCAEMHSGFAALRGHCPMNIEATLTEVGARIWAEQEAVRADVARIEALWTRTLDATGGPFLYGHFGAVDAYYAPVCMRLRTYGLPVSDMARGYIERLVTATGVRAWIEDALDEEEFLPFEEPYRTHR
jgi:glutathione S-transferase